MNSREVIRALSDDGWVLDRVKGDHHQFKHATKAGTVTVPHPKKDLSVWLVKSIERQSGLRLWRR